MDDAVFHYYKKNRAHGYPALAAWNSARSFVHFRKCLSASVKRDKQRTKAAKKGWKTRRANQH